MDRMNDKKSRDIDNSTPEAASELKGMVRPCPFCGEMPEIRRKGNAYTKSRSVTIRCPGCRVERTDGAIRHDLDWCETIAIEHWNQRVSA